MSPTHGSGSTRVPWNTWERWRQAPARTRSRIHTCLTANDEELQAESDKSYTCLSFHSQIIALDFPPQAARILDTHAAADALKAWEAPWVPMRSTTSIALVNVTSAVNVVCLYLTFQINLEDFVIIRRLRATKGYRVTSEGQRVRTYYEVF